MIVLKEVTGQDIAIRVESVKMIRPRGNDHTRISFNDNTNIDVVGTFKNIANLFSEDKTSSVGRKRVEV